MRRWTGRRIAIAATAGVVLVVVTAYGIFAYVSGGGEDPVSLADVPAGPTSTTVAFDGEFDGAWTLLAGDSFVGYRVREQLAFLPAPNDATGRTTAVEGTLEIEGLRIVATSVTADLALLESDESRRDDAIRTNGLESATYPTATFDLTEPIVLDQEPAEGEVVAVEATGDLTLHGVTRSVTVPLEARWDGGRIAVVGSLAITFADYDITPPSIGPATVEDHGTMELQLVFVPA
jgi:polyisoprenoid-binding protein YceI